MKASIRKFLPKYVLNRLRYIQSHRYWFLYNYIIPYKQRKAINKLAKKDKPLRCVFLALFESIWKYDGVYSLLQKDPRFEPVILICPIVNYGYDNMVSRMYDCYTYLKNKGYNVIMSYNKQTDSYLDLRNDLHPDIIFYTNPYKGLIDDRYYVDRFTDVLSVYVPYCAQEGIPAPMDYNLDSHNRFWRYYTLTDYHKSYSKELALNRGRNVKVTGYPQIEKLINDDYIPSDKNWKQNKTKKKRIIWSPHHTLDAVGPVDYSTFLKYSEFMQEMVEKYKDKVQWVFKPHPLLRNKLDLLWGKEKTDNYYAFWETNENTSFVNGDYVDLFLTSDAMIHDCGSFVFEYLLVNKPVLRPLNNIPLNQLYNQFALDCLDNYYFAKSESEIEQFIKMVISGDDAKKEQRTDFLKNKVIGGRKTTPSQMIVEDILTSIKERKVFVD